MKKLKVCNCYAGIGGNRKHWTKANLGIDLDITAIEHNEKIAKIHQGFFPNDKMRVTDAHQYLLDHFKEYDFIFSSPPCQSHSSFRKNICVRYRGTQPVYPDMILYQEILFLKHHFKGRWVIENVKPYYNPLIEPTAILDRHYFWSNFPIKNKIFKKDNIRKAQIPDLQKKYGFDLSKYKLKNKRQILRNCVEPELGLHILKEALRAKENENRTLLNRR